MCGVLCFSCPPRRSCNAGLPWHNPHPCLRRLKPARTAATRVALRVVIMPCAVSMSEHVVARFVLADAVESRVSVRSRQSGGFRYLRGEGRGAYNGVRRVAWRRFSGVASARDARQSAPSDTGVRADAGSARARLVRL